MVALAAEVAIEFVYGIASLILISLGLAIIFGMMRVINMAHGEFLVIGSYAAILAVHHGVNVWLSTLVVAPLAVGVIGYAIERLIIRHLYGRMIDTMLATWGLSIFIIGVLTTVFGDTTEGISTPLGGFKIGAYQASSYSLFVIGFTAVTASLVFAVLRYTRLGLFARGTMQNPAMADALGISTARVYSVTFALGAALAGLAGGVLAPISGVFPTVGGAYIGRAFITVLGGGPSVLAGTASASLLFGLVNEAATFAANPVFGEVALLLAAIILIRLLPQGITGRYLRGSL